MLVRGVVCKKNVAHRRMTSKVDKPRLLVLGGALEYQRVTNLFSSVDTLLQQVVHVTVFLSLVWCLFGCWYTCWYHHGFMLMFYVLYLGNGPSEDGCGKDSFTPAKHVVG